MRRGISVMLLVLCAGCQTIPPAPEPIPPLPLAVDDVPVQTAPAPPLSAEDRATLIDSEPRWVEGKPLEVTRKAARMALVKPAIQGFDRGMLVYPFRNYGVFWAAVPLFGSLHIQLQPGEMIRLVASLPESDWIVQRDDASSPLEVSHLVISPKKEHLQSKLTLITTMGVYYLELETQEATGLYGLSWKHPARPRS